MFAIAPYHVEVLDDKKQPQDLWNFFHKNSLKSFLDGHLGEIHNVPKSPSENKAFVLRKIFQATPTSAAGVFNTGMMGFESEIYNTDAKKVTHKRKKNEADLVPFQFSFYMPKNIPASQKTRGLLLLGRFNVSGIRGLVVPVIREQFAKQYPGFDLKVERILPDMVMRSILASGAVKKIRLIKRDLPKDYADVLSAADRNNFEDLEIVIRTKKSTAFSDVNWILDAIKHKKTVSSIFTLPNFTPDNIKIELNHGGKSRTVNIGSPGKVSSNIDISHVQVDSTGHIANQDWLNEADDLAAEIYDSWGAGKLTWNSKV